MALGGVVVREASSSDLDALLDLYVGFYGELRRRQGWRVGGREEYRGDVEAYLARDKVFLALDGGVAVGFIRVSEREGAYWLEELYVRPEYRGRGIGRRLVEAAEAYVRERDSHVYIMVLPQDRRAMGFWLHMGYRVLNTVELVKNLDGGVGDVRPVPFLGSLLLVYRWAVEDYTELERRFLSLVEELAGRGWSGEDLLRVFVEALEERLRGQGPPGGRGG